MEFTSINLFKFFKTNPRIEVIILNVRTNPKDNYYGRIHPDDLENAILNYTKAINNSDDVALYYEKRANAYYKNNKWNKK